MAPFLNFIGAAAAPGGPTKSFSWTASDQSSADAGSHSFVGKAIGTADATRKILVMVGGVNGLPAVSVTVGGVGLTFVDKKNNGANAVSVEAWIGDIPTGTSATIVVTWTGTSNLASIDVYALYGLASNTPIDVEKWDPTGGGDSRTITTVVDGITVASVIAFGIVGAASTWTQLTKDSDTAIEGGQWFHSGASMTNTGTSLTFIHTCATGGNPNCAAMALSF